MAVAEFELRALLNPFFISPSYYFEQEVVISIKNISYPIPINIIIMETLIRENHVYSLYVSVKHNIMNSFVLEL
jgi:hypothetical protein